MKLPSCYDLILTFVGTESSKTFCRKPCFWQSNVFSSPLEMWYTACYDYSSEWPPTPIHGTSLYHTIGLNHIGRSSEFVLHWSHDVLLSTEFTNRWTFRWVGPTVYWYTAILIYWFTDFTGDEHWLSVPLSLQWLSCTIKSRDPCGWVSNEIQFQCCGSTSYFNMKYGVCRTFSETKRRSDCSMMPTSLSRRTARWRWDNIITDLKQCYRRNQLIDVHEIDQHGCIYLVNPCTPSHLSYVV